MTYIKPTRRGGLDWCDIDGDCPGDDSRDCSTVSDTVCGARRSAPCPVAFRRALELSERRAQALRCIRREHEGYISATMATAAIFANARELELDLTCHPSK